MKKLLLQLAITIYIPFCLLPLEPACFCIFLSICVLWNQYLDFNQIDPLYQIQQIWICFLFAFDTTWNRVCILLLVYSQYYYYKHHCVIFRRYERTLIFVEWIVIIVCITNSIYECCWYQCLLWLTWISGCMYREITKDEWNERVLISYFMPLFPFIPYNILRSQTWIFIMLYIYTFDRFRWKEKDVRVRSRLLLILLQRHIIHQPRVASKKITKQPVCGTMFIFFMEILVLYVKLFYPWDMIQKLSLSLFIVRRAKSLLTYSDVWFLEEFHSFVKTWNDQYPGWENTPLGMYLKDDANVLETKVYRYMHLKTILHKSDIVPKDLLWIIVDYTFSNGPASHLPMVDSNLIFYLNY